MSAMVELKNTVHGELKIVENAAIDYASKTHSIALRVAEVGKATTSFPVFFLRDKNSGALGLTAVASFEENHNVFVEDGQWCANYQPSSLQTHPFFLILSEEDNAKYAIGIDEESDALSSTNGEALFDGENPSVYLKKIMRILEEDYKNDMQTFQFAKYIESLGLLKAIDVFVQYEDAVNTLTGLMTVDEEVLQSLSSEKLQELNSRGYLLPLYTMLASSFQFNALIRANNKIKSLGKIKQIKLKSVSAKPIA